MSKNNRATRRPVKSVRLPIYTRKKQPPLIPRRCPGCGGSINYLAGAAYLTSASLPLANFANWWDVADRIGASLDLSFHGPPGEFEVYCNLPVVTDVQGAQFDLTFCSIRCMRSFLNVLCDQLEDAVVTEGKRQESLRKRVSRKARRTKE